MGAAASEEECAENQPESAGAPDLVPIQTVDWSICGFIRISRGDAIGEEPFPAGILLEEKADNRNGNEQDGTAENRVSGAPTIESDEVLRNGRDHDGSCAHSGHHEAQGQSPGAGKPRLDSWGVGDCDRSGAEKP